MALPELRGTGRLLTDPRRRRLHDRAEHIAGPRTDPARWTLCPTRVIYLQSHRSQKCHRIRKPVRSAPRALPGKPLARPREWTHLNQGRDQHVSITNSCPERPPAAVRAPADWQGVTSGQRAARGHGPFQQYALKKNQIPRQSAAPKPPSGGPANPQQGATEHIVIVGLFGEPIGRRTMWIVVVPKCPAPRCSGMHHHRVAHFEGGSRAVVRRCPTTGVQYIVTPAARAQGVQSR